MSLIEEELRKKEIRNQKILFWALTIPVGVAICILTAPIIPITGAAMGYCIHKLYRETFR